MLGVLFRDPPLFRGACCFQRCINEFARLGPVQAWLKEDSKRPLALYRNKFRLEFVPPGGAPGSFSGERICSVLCKCGRALARGALPAYVWEEDKCDEKLGKIDPEPRFYGVFRRGGFLPCI